MQILQEFSMKLSALLFISYRLIEKLCRFRMETKLGYYLFSSLRPAGFASLDNDGAYEDKRSVWETLRLKDNAETLVSHITKMFDAGEISFENSMETSIRGINCILSYDQGHRIGSDNNVIHNYLRACYRHAVLCPDLYLRRSGFGFSDESNNHRFYNLLFIAFYQLHLKKRVSFKPLEEFIHQRLIDDSFYDEGSSYYHFGVVDALLKLRAYLQKTSSEQDFSAKFNSWLDLSERSLPYFRDINFGDRDGTLIAPWMPHNHKISQDDQSLNTEKFHLITTSTSWLCLRKQNWCKLGTQGHVHDDFGHVSYASQSSQLIDVGVFLYQYEPLSARKKYHNFPYLRSHDSISYFRKFERHVPRNKDVTLNAGTTVVKEKGRDAIIERELLSDGALISDYLTSTISKHNVANWRFYVTGDIHVCDANERGERRIEVGNDIQFTLHPQMQYRVCNGHYYPEYGQSKPCRVILMRLKIMAQKHQKTQMLTISFLQT